MTTALAQALEKAGIKEVRQLYREVILPFKPPIDKIVALHLAIAGGHVVPDAKILFVTDNNGSEGTLATVMSEGAYPIDVGSRKYNTGVAGSATEYIVRDLGIEETAATTELVRTANENNRTGYLRRLPFSVALTLRELYELLPEDDLWHLKVIRATEHVIACRQRILDGKSTRDIADLETLLPDLAKELSASKGAAFTLGGYLQDMRMLGLGYQEIRTRLGFWTESMKHLAAARAEGARVFREGVWDRYTIGTFMCIVLPTDNHFVFEAAIKAGCPIRIVVKEDGHTTISTDRLNVDTLAAALKEREPGQWYHHEVRGTLINGGVQYVTVPATDLKPADVCALMRTHPPQKRKQK